jgi:hypothetical protein
MPFYEVVECPACGSLLELRSPVAWCPACGWEPYQGDDDPVELLRKVSSFLPKEVS